MYLNQKKFVYFHGDNSSFDGKKKRGGSKRILEEQKIQYQYKREMKGAIRDVRKDQQFLSRHKLQEQMAQYVPKALSC
jgi:hypothetical protein